MAATAVTNSSQGWLVVWLEPLGEDRWLKPGETAYVSNDYRGDKAAFTLDYWVNDENRASGIENVNLWVMEGDAYAEFVDGAGRVLECGYQRPADTFNSFPDSRGCEYCADDANMYFGHVELIGSSETLHKLLLKCPRCGWLYESSNSGLKDATHISAADASKKFPA